MASRISPIPLPIDPRIPEVLSALREGRSLVLQASPGSGKTTRIPPALLRADFCAEKREILVLEPRRLAAKFAARRVAEELGGKVGGIVGYQFRFERAGDGNTRLWFLTEGMLMRRLIRDPELRGVAAVVLDEFHERHLHGDLALALLRRLQGGNRPDLRLVVMSATLDSASVAASLGGCPVLSVDAPLHPVEVEYLKAPPSGRFLERTVAAGVRQVLDSSGSRSGDVLVFLPGMAEIRRTQSELEDLEEEGIDVLPLHGELSRDEQDRAILPGKRRKVILSTNVAETSLTIEGLGAVVDSGLHRVASYSWWSGVPALRTRPISRASATQRAGRAGRTGPGRCLRLYTQGDFASRPPFDTPEVQRADLCQTVLELCSLGAGDPLEFPWFEAPAVKSVEAALTLLYRLGALDRTGPGALITALGRRLVRLPAHPRLGRLLVEGERLGILEEAATLAALVAEGDLERLDASEQALSHTLPHGLSRVRSHLLSSLEGGGPGAGVRPGDREERLGRLARCALAGFPDRVARKRVKGTEAELIFSGGGSAPVEFAGPVLEGDYFVVLDVRDRQGHGDVRSRSKVHSVCRIEPEWLFDLEPSLIRESEATEWDPARGRSLLIKRLQYDELVLSEDRIAVESGGGIGILSGALGKAPGTLGELSEREWVETLARLIGQERAESLLGRLALVARHCPELFGGIAWPGSLGKGVENLAATKSSLSELKDAEWEGELPSILFPQDASRFESLAPRTVTLAKGRKCTVHYPLDQPPWIGSRLQDFFGLSKGPSILGGKLPLTLHLLAPNQRAIQVTTDLTGFWQRAYRELRPSLSRRYPRHAWPEDPSTLVADSG